MSVNNLKININVKMYKFSNLTVPKVSTFHVYVSRSGNSGLPHSPETDLSPAGLI